MKTLVLVTAAAMLTWSGCSGDSPAGGGAAGAGRGGSGSGGRGGGAGGAGTAGAAGAGGGGGAGVAGSGGTAGTGTAGGTGGGGRGGAAGAGGGVAGSGGGGTGGAAGNAGTGGGTGARGGTGGASGGGGTGTGGAAGGGGTGTGGAAGGGGRGGTGGGYIACATPTALLIGGQDTGFVKCGTGVLHRERAADCPSLLPRSGGGACTAVGTADEPCTNDASCTARPRGACMMVPTSHYPGCGCVYGCVRDADCAAGQICECGDPVGICRAAACANDGQCATGSLCASAALGWGGCAFNPPARGYQCQSTADTCLTNAECTSSLPACAFSSASGTRGCHEAQLLCP